MQEPQHESGLTSLTGVGPALAEKLGRLGVYQVDDLLFLLPDLTVLLARLAIPNEATERLHASVGFREIGVMRAIGASSWQVIRLFIGEGLLLGLLSWMIALPLSIPTAYVFTTQGLSFALNQQLVYQFTPTGAGLWLVIITMLAIFASALPARGASRISVRESLSYS